ncbi:hypothetical protein BDM02DRAFT_3075889, partial [Thelephora ganbajun]
GVIGVVKAYYGCVEAQGRGSLHCHMVVWVHGGLNSDEIREKAIADNEWRDRLINFLDETICNVIPADPDPDIAHLDPCLEDTLKARVKDLRNVILECQCHSHTGTCYKHCKSGGPKECRFNLDEKNVVPFTYFNEETGSFVLRRLNGMINNCCPTIAEGCRCNSDIKFITSGDAVKSVLFYVTDYISKMQEKSHVSFGALEAALKKLGDYDPTDTDPKTRGKQTLIKCVYSVISHQELSGQQVAAYLKGYGDHYSSHVYWNLYWTAFERSINADTPSPECYEKEVDGTVTEDTGMSTEPHDEQDDDVIITATADGNVVQCSTQVHDYRFRALALSHLSVWDFIARVDKVA